VSVTRLFLAVSLIKINQRPRTAKSTLWLSNNMKFGSVCSGIEAASAAWEPLRWQSVFFSEIEPFPCSVLAHHYPETPNFGDMTKFKEWPDAVIDVLVGGTPCQSFSVAGLRKGLDDPRGNLMLTFGAIANKYRPTWLVWENVPGVLSSNGGKDFGTFLGMLAELGYGFAYRVLDAQYFGVAQRRRRVFVVAHLGDWRAAAAVLFERHSLSGDLAPRREAWKETSSVITKSVAGSLDTECGGKMTHQTVNNGHIIGTITARMFNSLGARDVEEGAILPVISQPVHVIHGTQDPCVSEKAFAVGRNNGQENAIAYGIPGNWIGRKPENGGNAVEPMMNVSPCQTKTDRHGVAVAIPINTMNAMRSPGADPSTGCGIGKDGEAMFTVTKTNHHAVAAAIGWSEELTAHTELQGTLQRGGDGGRHEGVMQPNMQVRRLTPVECERLQGFPDSYTSVQHQGKPAADGPRYKALGNSMAVPVMSWIGKRIQQVEAIK
jgi:DNA (cytosine-5)-methyltransferase 1